MELQKDEIECNIITFNTNTVTTPTQIANSFNKQFTNTQHINGPGNVVRRLQNITPSGIITSHQTDVERNTVHSLYPYVKLSLAVG